MLARVREGLAHRKLRAALNRRNWRQDQDDDPRSPEFAVNET